MTINTPKTLKGTVAAVSLASRHITTKLMTWNTKDGPQTSPFDLEAILESDERPSQTFSHRDVSSDENWRDDADDYELSQKVSLAEPLPHCDTPSEGQKVNPCYFGIDRPFDLTVLTTDINE